MSEISIPGDPGGLAGLASQLDAAAGQVDAVHSRIAANGLEGSWSGAAANAFCSTLDKLPGELEKVVQAFGDAARALSSFSATLSELQQKAAWYNRQIESARQDLASAEARRHAAETELQTARSRHGAAGDPVSLHAAQNAVHLGESMVGEAVGHVEESTSRISSLESAAATLRDEYDRAVQTCCGALDAARHAGSHSILGVIAAHVKRMGELAEDGVGVIWHGAKGLAEDFEEDVEGGLKAFDEHWGMWRAELVAFNEVFGEKLAAVTVALPLIALRAAEVPIAGDIVAGFLLTVDGGVLLGGTAIQALDSGAILEGDRIEGLRGRAEYGGKILEDEVRLGVSLIPDEKVVSGLGRKAGRELEAIPAVRKSIPAISSATKKLVSQSEQHFGREIFDGAAAKEGKALAGKAVDQAGEWVEDGVDRLSHAVISPPLESPLQFKVVLPELAL